MRFLSAVLFILFALSNAQAQQGRPPLTERDIADITKLVMLEDRRDYDEAELSRLLRSPNPEIRRRAARSIARINDPRGRALLHGARQDADTSVAATVIFGIGQLRDSAAVPLFDSLLASPETPATVAFEAARALGKIHTPAARAALAKYLSTVREDDRTRPVIGEALFSIGHNPTRGDIAPIARFAASENEETRWHAAWALFRPRNPAAVPVLMQLVRNDPSGVVRSWAVRGLTTPMVDSSSVSRTAAREVLHAAVKDSDRRVRTEAVRALATWHDSASFDVLVAALNDADTWISVSAAEALASHRNRADDAVAALTAASAPARPSALRIVAVQSLLALAPQKAAEPAQALAADTLPLSQQTARTVAARLNPPAADAQRRPAGGGNRPSRQRPLDTGKTEADYRRIVERWVVPDYNGAPRPRVEWTMPKGVVELELYPADAPLAVEDFMQVLESGAIVGTEFSRVVPNFVAQQRGIYNDHELRDEVTRLGLTRGNLSWASAGLDTGRPGYTLGSTPQPHNEGDFTTLGRVVRGLDVVDHIELGDRIVAARRIR